MEPLPDGQAAPAGMPAASSVKLPDFEAVLLHQLAERLTAVGNYLTVLRRQAETEPKIAGPQPIEILDLAAAQLRDAGDVFRRLRRALTRDGQPDAPVIDEGVFDHAPRPPCDTGKQDPAKRR
jgi:hypothetical protein